MPAARSPTKLPPRSTLTSESKTSSVRREEIASVAKRGSVAVGELSISTWMYPAGLATVARPHPDASSAQTAAAITTFPAAPARLLIAFPIIADVAIIAEPKRRNLQREVRK